VCRLNVNEYVVETVVSRCVAAEPVSVHVYTVLDSWVGQKSKPVYYCNDFVYYRLTFVIFGTYTLREISNWKI